VDNEKLVASPNRKFAFTLIWTGIVGWFAAFSLTLERIHLAADPTASLSCDINVWISCAKVMLTPQAKLFGFPNPIIGLGAFVFPIAVGFAILAGAQFKMWFWRLFTLGVTLGFGFVVWLFIQTNYVIHALCPYCMLAWIAMIPMFWKVFTWAGAEGVIDVPVRTVKWFVNASESSWFYAALTELLALALIVIAFWPLIVAMFKTL
jgi:uncharacterized membrane protein